MGLLDYMEGAKNKLSGLLGEMPISRMIHEGVQPPTVNKLRDALYAMPKPFDANDQTANELAMALWNPGGLLGKIVYHGSPHKFTKFDASKIGTGEGAQAYGHGIYLADAEDVAKQYKADRSYVGASMAGKPVANDWGPEWIAKNAIDIHGEDAAKHLRGVLEQNKSLKARGQAEENAKVAAAIDLISSGKVSPSGALYKADLPDEWIPKMLDWDKPLKEQPEVLRALESHPTMGKQSIGWRGAPDGMWERAMTSPTRTGEWLYREIANNAPKETANALQQAGIPGIRYLDGGSRGKGQGSYNYVVFPGLEDQVKILERNGKGLLDF